MMTFDDLHAIIPRRAVERLKACSVAHNALLNFLVRNMPEPWALARTPPMEAWDVDCDEDEDE